jgi:hypothetical protein
VKTLLLGCILAFIWPPFALKKDISKKIVVSLDIIAIFLEISFFKANGGQINANIQPSNKVCSRVSVPKPPFALKKDISKKIVVSLDIIGISGFAVLMTLFFIAKPDIPIISNDTTIFLEISFFKANGGQINANIQQKIVVSLDIIGISGFAVLMTLFFIVGDQDQWIYNGGFYIIWMYRNRNNE